MAGMDDPPKLLGTLETALYAQDLDRAERFWSGVMGLVLIARQPGRHLFYRCGAQVLLIFDPRATAAPPRPDSPLPVPPHGAQGPSHFCMAAEAGVMDQWRAHLERNGIGIEADFEWPQGGRSIYFRDPAGNSIELADPVIWNGSRKG